MRTFLQRLFFSSTPVPDKHRSNFINLYWDIAWWGLLNGSILVFLNIYASRLGASTLQLSLITSAPAIMNFLVTLPAERFLRGKRPAQVVSWAAVFTRVFYLILLPLPVLLNSDTQIWVIIAITLIMNIPGTVAVVSGSVFFADVVPPDWRAQVVGIRNALLAFTSMITSVVVGQVLNHFDFNLGYQIVFFIGCVGGLVSASYLFRIHPDETHLSPQPTANNWQKTSGVRWDILRGPFRKVMAIIFIYNLSTFLGGPIFPQYQVRVLQQSDLVISLGTGMFWVIHAVGSTQSRLMASKLGFKRLYGLGFSIVALSCMLFLLSYNVWILLICQFIGGVGWAMVSGGVMNYVYEKVPETDRPPYMAWNNLAANAAVLVGGMAASPLTNMLGLEVSGWVVVVARFLTALIILKWG